MKLTRLKLENFRQLADVTIEYTDGLTAITLGKSTPQDVVANVDQVLNKYLQSQKKA